MNTAVLKKDGDNNYYISATHNGNFVEVLRGDLWFPNLNYTTDPEPIGGPRLSASLRKICTILEGEDLADVASRIGTPDERDKMDDLEFTVKFVELEIEIEAEIGKVIESGKYYEDSLRYIFHLIQLWGGSEARGIYVKNGGFENNWNYETYRYIASTCVNAVHEQSDNTVECLMHLLAHDYPNRIRQFGLSFASKHFRFWNSFVERPHLAILDKVVCEGLFGKAPSAALYREYTKKLLEFQAESNIPALDVESKLFEYFQSKEGKIWIKLRKG